MSSLFSRNFLTATLPFLAEEADPDFAALCATSSSFMNGSFVPEYTLKNDLNEETEPIFKLINDFSSTLQFTTRLNLSAPKILRPGALLQYQMETKRYFTRQLTSLECRPTSRADFRIFLEKCLPNLQALRKLSFAVRKVYRYWYKTSRKYVAALAPLANLEELSIDGSKCGDMWLSDIWKTNPMPHLRKLKVITGDQSCYLHWISQFHPQLEVLDISFNCLVYSERYMEIFGISWGVPDLRKMNDLRELYLRGDNILLEAVVDRLLGYKNREPPEMEYNEHFTEKSEFYRYVYKNGAFPLDLESGFRKDVGSYDTDDEYELSPEDFCPEYGFYYDYDDNDDNDDNDDADYREKKVHFMKKIHSRDYYGEAHRLWWRESSSDSQYWDNRKKIKIPRDDEEDEYDAETCSAVSAGVFDDDDNDDNDDDDDESSSTDYSSETGVDEEEEDDDGDDDDEEEEEHECHHDAAEENECNEPSTEDNISNDTAPDEDTAAETISNNDGDMCAASSLSPFSARPGICKKLRKLHFSGGPFLDSHAGEVYRIINEVGSTWVSELDLNDLKFDRFMHFKKRSLRDGYEDPPYRSDTPLDSVCLDDRVMSFAVEKFPNCTELDFRNLNQIGDSSLVAIGKHCTSLRKLRLPDLGHCTDKGIAALFDPEKSTNTFRTLEELVVGTREKIRTNEELQDDFFFRYDYMGLVHGENWFGSTGMIREKSSFRLKKLDCSMVVKLDADGILQIMHAFSHCLQEFNLPKFIQNKDQYNDVLIDFLWDIVEFPIMTELKTVTNLPLNVLGLPNIRGFIRACPVLRKLTFSYNSDYYGGVASDEIREKNSSNFYHNLAISYLHEASCDQWSSFEKQMPELKQMRRLDPKMVFRSEGDVEDPAVEEYRNVDELLEDEYIPLFDELLMELAKSLREVDEKYDANPRKMIEIGFSSVQPDDLLRTEVKTWDAFAEIKSLSRINIDREYLPQFWSFARKRKDVLLCDWNNDLHKEQVLIPSKLEQAKDLERRNKRIDERIKQWKERVISKKKKSEEKKEKDVEQN